MDDSVKSKRVVKNTIFLYIRMFVALIVSLYTSRVVLDALGVEDFGIYNVVGGIVATFSIISGAFSQSTSRFFAFELGRNNEEGIYSLYYNSKSIHLILAIGVYLITSIIGIYLIENKLVIPESRFYAAKIVLYTSIFSFSIKLLTVPNKALVIAKESMDFYALTGILEVLLKLIVALILTRCKYDKLEVYSVLLLLEPIILFLLYGIYCKRINHRFDFITHRVDKYTIKKMASFAGWDSLGALERILLDQGINILINTFFNPAINGARAVAFQVKNAIVQFSTSFQIATFPQITKSFAENDIEYMHSLIQRACKFSFFLLLVPIVPLIAYTNQVLSLWLKEVPDHTVLFVQLSLIYILIDSSYEILCQGAKASGEIKKFRVLTCALSLFNLPLSYLALNLGAEAEITMIISCGIGVLVLFLQLFILRSLIDLNPIKFLKNIAIKCYGVAFITIMAAYLSTHYSMPTSLLSLLMMSAIWASFTILVIWGFGIDTKERKFIIDFIRKKIV